MLRKGLQRRDSVDVVSKQYGHYILTRKSFDRIPVRSGIVLVHVFIGQLKVSRNGRSYTYHRLLRRRYAPLKAPASRLVLSLGTLDLLSKSRVATVGRTHRRSPQSPGTGSVWDFRKLDQLAATVSPNASRSKQQRQQAQR